MTTVKKHLRSGRNKKSVVRQYVRKDRTHRIVDGEKQVYVDHFWKHDDYPNAPKPGWSYEHLLKEKAKLQRDLSEGLTGVQILPHRKYGLLTRRIKKINRLLKAKGK